MAIKIVRRQFIATLGGTALAWPLTAQAQQVERMQRIGVLSGVNADDAEVRADIAAFRQELQQLGWTDGRNVRFDIRSAAGNATDARKYAAELVALAPDVILSVGSTSAAQLLQASHTVPIIFVIVPDPVGAGFVDRLSRPGGNFTGFMMFEYSLCGKWLELLKEIAPGLTRAAVLRDAGIAAGIPVRGHPVSGDVCRRGSEPGQLERRGRDRARRRGLCAVRPCRPNPDGRPVVGGSS
jgi:putative tryptophan/tyrosine transport system substrate-binding protein